MHIETNFNEQPGSTTKCEYGRGAPVGYLLLLKNTLIYYNCLTCQWFPYSPDP